MLIPGCASIKVKDDLMNPVSVQRDQHAVMIVDKTLTIFTFDGMFTGFMLLGGKQQIVPIMPGTHELSGNYYNASSSSSTSWNGSVTVTTTTEEATGIKITYDFVSGHYYKVTPQKNGNMVALQIEDITSSTNSKDQKLIKTASEKAAKIKIDSFPQELLSENPSPTKFEGTWLWEDKGNNLFSEYNFEGNSFLSEGSALDFTSNSYSVKKTRGKFMFNDKKLTIYLLQQWDENGSTWKNIPLVRLNLNYTLNSNTLTTGGGLIGKTVYNKK
jgi:hypothetical protein